MFWLIPEINRRANRADAPALIFYYRLCDLERCMKEVTVHRENNDMDQGQCYYMQMVFFFSALICLFTMSFSSLVSVDRL